MRTWQHQAARAFGSFPQAAAATAAAGRVLTLAPARRCPLDRLLRSSAGAVLRLQAGGRRRSVRRGPLGGAPDPSPAFRRLALLLADRCVGALGPHGCCRANRCGREHCGRASWVPRLRLLVSKEGWRCVNRVIWPGAQAGNSDRRGAACAQRGSRRRAWRRQGGASPTCHPRALAYACDMRIGLMSVLPPFHSCTEHTSQASQSSPAQQIHRCGARRLTSDWRPACHQQRCRTHWRTRTAAAAACCSRQDLRLVACSHPPWQRSW